MGRRCVLATLVFAFGLARATEGDLGLRRVDIGLPGAPARLVMADLDRDGRRDLLAVVAFTRWGQVGSDRIEDAVMITEVVPALFERREIRAWLAEEDGSFAPAVSALEIDDSVLALDEGSRSVPVVALRDGGVSTLRVDRGPAGATLRWEPLWEEPGAFDGSGTFLPGLRLGTDVDGDGENEIVVPTEQGLAIFKPGKEPGLVPLDRVPFPGSASLAGSGAVRSFLLPTAEDVTGDGVLDLVAIGRGSPPEIHVAMGRGDGKFSGFRVLSLSCLEFGSGEDASTLSHFGDLDGDGLPEIVLRRALDTDRGNLKKVREPRSRYSFHRVSEELEVSAAPYVRAEIPGYASSGGFTGDEPDFRDVDGDGRKDLIAITLDFSVFQALRVLTTKRISVGVEFAVWVQQTDGSFERAPNKGLDEKLKFDLNDLRLGRMAQFAGDFDGDGRLDFVHLGRGRRVTVHLGRPGGIYPEEPDLTLELSEEPQDLALVQVRDLDGDGRADIAVTRIGEPEDESISAPARVELLLSGGSQ